MLNKKILPFLIAAATAVAFSSCKNDSEDDLLNNQPTNRQPASVQGLYINEVASQPNPDKIELYNSTEAAIDLAGFILQDDKGAAEEWIIPAGTSIPAKGFVMFTNGVDFAFGLSSSGDKVVLLDRSRAVIDQITIPAMTGGSYARTTDGGAVWNKVSSTTFGGSNN